MQESERGAGIPDQLMSMATKKVLLSHMLSVTTPCPGDGPPVRIEPFSRLADGEISNTKVVTFWNHSGTHIDGPTHVCEGYGDLSEYFLPEGFFFTHPFVLDIPCEDSHLISAEDLMILPHGNRSCDLLLLRTGFQRFRTPDPERFRLSNPGMSVAASEWIVENCPNIRCVGMDAISYAAAEHVEEGIEAHLVLLRRSPPVFIVEDMNLDHDLTTLSSVTITPFLVEGLDSCPCTIVGEIEINLEDCS